MYKSKSPRWAGLRHAALALLAFGTLAVLPLRADTVYVTTFTGSVLTTCDPVCYDPLGTGCTVSTFGSTAISGAPGVPTRTKCTYGWLGAVNWSITPALALENAGGVYRIEVAHVTATCSPDVVVTAYCDPMYGQTSASCTNSPVFQQSYGGNTWKTMGYITNAPGISDPVIIFKYESGAVGPTSLENRLYIDAFKFTFIDLCDGVVGDLAVTGPLAAGNMYVPVTGVTAGATNVTIYADEVEIGQTNYAAGFAAGALDVPVNSALVKDKVIKATQSKPSAAPAGFCTSAMPTSGPPVGSGANPQLTVVLSCGEQSALEGPAGADTSGAATTTFHVKCTGLAGSSATAPVGGAVLTPGSCWQTITFDFATDPMRNWQANTAYTSPNPYCLLDAISFAIDSTTPDSGPYDIYVDLIKNGDTVIEDFEGWNAGDGVMFTTPNVPSFPGPTTTYLETPNSALVSQANAYEGTNSCRIRWQWKTTDTIRWARVLASRPNGATYPQLDMSKPVTVRLLVLPVGETAGKLGVGAVPSQTKAPGESVTFSVTATGVGPFTYQWKKDGSPVGTDSSSYTIGSVSAGDAGTYTVTVDNADCEAIESSPAVLTVSAPPVEAVTIDSITASTIAYSGGAGAKFILLQSATVNAPMSAWTTAGQTNTATPGTFTVPGPGYYRVESQ